MDQILALGAPGAAALIVFAIITVFKVQLPQSWWNDQAEGLVTLVCSITVVELLLLYSGKPTLKEYLQGAVAGAVVSLAVRYGHGKLETMLEARVRKQIEADETKAQGGTK